MVGPQGAEELRSENFTADRTHCAKSEAPTIVNLYSTNQLTLEHIHVTFDGKAK